ncbi:MULTISPECIES: ABC transporter permease [Rhizobium/Agrobacterium group]|uniref:ABC transporter permease n=1 Tax=Rhizobium/Agrobacterium group TaxID=227290 RepID=UPI000B3FDEDC|nr:MULTISPECIES: ABC transporter permease [Rhizobium/Agrobacterium group]MCF1445655.1 ABC transporter permease [Allorhizobium ampelinum]MCF1472179.1 ABC transporter permease [Allorhizobium ampelinum]MCF1480985.1 ABC transporter permease [Allorhizobium ampelinum]MVA49378.1 ABC transporter permease subunit [Agrobacterium vitis]NSZ44836.1 ABC transporter permease [Agrobacterium vitis]
MTRLNSVSASAAEAILEDGLIGEPVAQWRRTWGRLLRLRSGQVGLFIIGMLILVAIFAPVLAPYDPDQVLIGVEQVKRREPPCVHLLGCDASRPQHIMGIDGNARDSFSRILYGTRVSLVIGLTTVTCALFFGVLLGAIAGYFRGWVDNIIMRIMDVILGFPSLLLAIAIVAVLGPGIRNALLAISIVSVPAYARVTRASVLSVKTFDFVAATRVLGGSKWRILFQRVLPNAITPIVVLATLGVATAILDAAGLSFLGLGAQPPTPEWGTMLGAARNEIFSAPHLVFFPGLAIMLTVLGFNLLGDGLRDALDPRLHT